MAHVKPISILLFYLQGEALDIRTYMNFFFGICAFFFFKYDPEISHSIKKNVKNKNRIFYFLFYSPS